MFCFLVQEVVLRTVPALAERHQNNPPLSPSLDPTIRRLHRRWNVHEVLLILTLRLEGCMRIADITLVWDVSSFAPPPYCYSRLNYILSGFLSTPTLLSLSLLPPLNSRVSMNGNVHSIFTAVAASRGLFLPPFLA